MKRLKQIICIIGAAALAALYLLTLIFSLTDHSQAKSWLSASLYATVAIPILLYAFLLITRPLSERKKETAENTEQETAEQETDAPGNHSQAGNPQKKNS